MGGAVGGQGSDLSRKREGGWQREKTVKQENLTVRALELAKLSMFSSQSTGHDRGGWRDRRGIDDTVQCRWRLRQMSILIADEVVCDVHVVCDQGK